MADLIVGISKTAVQLLADKVKSAIKEEAEQWKTVQRDLVFITGEFEMMQAFLDTAAEEHVRNRIVRTWVRQVRDLSNDVEDCIEFVLHLDTTRRSWWLRLLPPSCSAGAKTGAEQLPVDEAVAETTLLRARVVDVSQRNIRYNLNADSASKPMPATMDAVEKTATSSFDVLINAIKKSGPLEDLAGLVDTKDTDLQVVSVCGTEGDLVRLAIVRKMYSDAGIHKKFQCRAWVKLVHPFDPHEFIRSLVTQFLRHSCQEQEVNNVGLGVLERMQQATQGDLIKEFAQKEKNNRYLIVLEDLCSMVQWDDIRSYLPDRKKGSRVVVLTHHPVVASQCTGEPCRVSELGQFSPGHSVRVYYKECFEHDRVQSFIKLAPQHPLFNDLLGRDTEMDELFKKTQESRLISVWGMPGVGKSALVKAIYDGKLRTSDQFKRHVWVNVSHPFNPADFCRSLLVSLHSESTSSKGKYAKAFQAEDPIKECRYYLSGCVYLFVIDGVQSNEDWDWIKSNLTQYGDSGCSIIIITSEESVAKHCAVSIDGMYNVKGLDATAANELFRKVAVEKYLDFLEMEEADLLLPKCGGLPRVIISVARYLASKPRDLLQQEMRRLRENFMQELATKPEFDSLRGVLAWMYAYLDTCPRHLKKHMLYLSIFPQDVIIRRRRLIRRWVAEGYARGTDSTSMEKYAQKIFDEVAALSIMQPVVEDESSNKVIGYRVNGLFREYVISRPVEETVFFPVEVSALENQGLTTTESIGQHLAVGSTSRNYDRIVFQSLDLSRLRSLTVFDSNFWSCYVSDRMRVLRVLDLENAPEFQDIGNNLPVRLKFLSLRGHFRISSLPDSVGDLLQLQTLDIRGTSIRTLPPFVTELRKLQYVRAGTTVAWTDGDVRLFQVESPSRGGLLVSSSFACLLPKFIRPKTQFCWTGGAEAPRGIGRLEALRTLGAVRVDSNNFFVHEILPLPQLKKLEVSVLIGKRRLGSLQFLRNMNHLESLTLRFTEKNHFSILGTPRSLRSLKMYGHVDYLPYDIKDCDNLVKLVLEMTDALSTENAMNVLGCVPSLRTLRLRVSKDEQHGGELRFPTALFSKLQVLEIACKSNLHVRFDEGAMDKLEHLKLHCLQGSEMQVSGLEHPVSLKQVWLLGFFHDALTEALQQQLVKHPKKPALKLEPDEPRSSLGSSD